MVTNEKKHWRFIGLNFDVTGQRLYKVNRSVLSAGDFSFHFTAITVNMAVLAKLGNVAIGTRNSSISIAISLFAAVIGR